MFGLEKTIKNYNKSCNKVCVAGGLKLRCRGLGIKGSAGEQLNGTLIG